MMNKIQDDTSAQAPEKTWPFPQNAKEGGVDLPEAEASSKKVKKELTAEQLAEIEDRKAQARAAKLELLAMDPNSPDNRKSRAKAVNDEIERRGLVVHGLNGKIRTVMVNLSTREERSFTSQGGKNAVILYAPLIVDGKVQITYAVSYLHPHDRFDFLEGKERALERFVAGKVEVAYYPLSSLFSIVNDDSAILIKRYLVNQLNAYSAGRRIEQGLGN